MTGIDVSGERAAEATQDAVADLKFEVVVLPVSDVDRAKTRLQLSTAREPRTLDAA
jgi:hypothetical protein